MKKCNNCNKEINKKYYVYRNTNYCIKCYEFYLDAVDQLNSCEQQQPKLKKLKFKAVE